MAHCPHVKSGFNKFLVYFILPFSELGKLSIYRFCFICVHAIDTIGSIQVCGCTECTVKCLVSPVVESVAGEYLNVFVIMSAYLSFPIIYFSGIKKCYMYKY